MLIFPVKFFPFGDRTLVQSVVDERLLPQLTNSLNIRKPNWQGFSFISLILQFLKLEDYSFIFIVDDFADLTYLFLSLLTFNVHMREKANLACIDDRVKNYGSELVEILEEKQADDGDP